MCSSRRVPVGVWWLCGLHLVLLVAHSLLVPTWLGPDEPNHVDLVVGVRETGRYPTYDERAMDPGIRASLEWAEFRRHARNLTHREAIPRGDRLTREELRPKGRSLDLGALGRPGTRNHMSQHPPGYYAALAGLAGAVDGLLPGDGLGSADREVAVLRWLSLLAVVPLPLVAWWVAGEAGLSPGAATAAAVVPLAVPQLSHIAAVVNSDGLLVLVLGLLTGVVVRIARGATGARTLALAGLLSGAALLVKALAFVVPLWVLAAVLVGWRRARPPMAPASPAPSPPAPAAPPAPASSGRPAAAPSPAWPARACWGPVVVYAAGTLVVGGWWWVGNVLRYGDIAPSIEYATRLSDPRAGFRPDLGRWLGNWGPNMLQRYWGEFGWIDVGLAGTLVVIASLVVATGIVLAIARALRDRRAVPPAQGADLPALLLLLAPTLLLMGFVAANGYRIYRNAGFGALVQGRYLFGGLVGLAVVVAAGWAGLPALWRRRQAHAPGSARRDDRDPWLSRWTPVVFLLGATVLQVAAVTTMLEFWWGRRRASLGDRLDALAAWSPWPTGVVWTVVVLLPAVAALTLVAVARDAWTGTPVPAPLATPACDRHAAGPIQGAPIRGRAG